MRTRNVVLLSISMCMLGFGLNSIANSANTSAKIAIVDTVKIVTSSSQVNSLKKDQMKKSEELQSWVKKAKADIEKQSTPELKQKKLESYKKELKQKQDALGSDYKNKLLDIDKKMTAAIEQEAKAGGYDLVFAKSSVLYGGEDITDKVSKALK